MVSSRNNTLYIKKNAFSLNKLETLANYEIGVHLVTTHNARKQPLDIFSSGFPKNVETQEGLAIYSEYYSGALTLDRLKELAYRVIALDCLRKGYRFSDTFDLIHMQYKLDRESAFTIVLRAYRAGGFTKDHLYLTGLKKIHDYYKKHQDLSLLLMGKVSMDYTRVLTTLVSQDLACTKGYYTPAFLENRNTNTTIDFILKNLR